MRAGKPIYTCMYGYTKQKDCMYSQVMNHIYTYCVLVIPQYEYNISKSKVKLRMLVITKIYTNVLASIPPNKLGHCMVALLSAEKCSCIPEPIHD